jgi:hypothetical protein
MSVKHLYLVAVVAVLGCAASASNRSGPFRTGNLLTAEEIALAHADINTAYDAIARLRPNWLAAHGVTSYVNNGSGTQYALVFVDGQQYGDLSSLRAIPAYHVGDIRYYDVTEAGARFGIRGGSSGAIEVRMLSP